MAYNQELIIDFPQVAHVGNDQWVYLEFRTASDAKQYLRISLEALPVLRKHIDAVEHQTGFSQRFEGTMFGS